MMVLFLALAPSLLKAEPGENTGVEEADQRRDQRNLESAEQAFQSGFATEAEHYLSRIPPDSSLQESRQLLELKVMLGLHRGDLPGARQGLRRIFRGSEIQAQSASPFSIYLAEELILLRQFPALQIFASRFSSMPWSSFSSTLESSQYPIFVCQFKREEGSLETLSGSPLDKHLQFANALAFSEIRGRRMNDGDRLQLEILGSVYQGYSRVRAQLDSEPSSDTEQLRNHLRLCRERLAQERSSELSAADSRWLEEYLYRLHFAGWALDGSAGSSFEFADFLLRQSDGDRGSLEALYLFRRTLDQLLLAESFRFSSHDEEKDAQNSRLNQMADVLRKIQFLYARMEMESDRTSVMALADSIENYLFSTRTEQDFLEMQRSLLDACGENRRNREALVLLIEFSPIEKRKGLEDLLLDRDQDRDSRELLALMSYRYGALAQSMP
jgi:hypothetical protein